MANNDRILAPTLPLSKAIKMATPKDGQTIENRS